MTIHREPELFIGIMSGTSADGIDAVIVDFSGSRPALIECLAYGIPEDMRQEILALSQPTENEIDRMGKLDRQLGELYANASIELLRKAKIDVQAISAIGCHGQTIRHRPPSTHNQGFTLQIGDANTTSALTGIPVVSDFRKKDMGLGGQGAPLVPAFHRAIFSSQTCNRCVVNVGGIANVTALSKNGSVTGFDTGPGNGLMDNWVLHNKRLPFDKNGEWAKAGNVNPKLLSDFLKDSYFQQPAPKSTGREYFNLDWITRSDLTGLAPEDIQATLLELTAKTICQAVDEELPHSELFMCGGGVKNSELMRRITELHPHKTSITDELGAHFQWVEAMAFAWLARQRMLGKAGNIPAVTGSTREAILGCVYLPA